MKINICLARFFNLLIISIVLLGLVLDYCPLQQGLRLDIQQILKDFSMSVLDYCPLQQGLRLTYFIQISL